MNPCRLLFCAFLAVSAYAQSNQPPFRDPALPIPTRVADLVSRLHTDEKISLLMMDSPAVPRLGIPAYHWWNEGLHGFARSGIATVFPQAIALAATWNPALLHQVGDVVSTEARAKYNHARLTQDGNTYIYQGITIWSPNINLFRDPRWGRGQETYGEDPFLTGTLAVGFVTGIQGNNPRYLKAVATLKHFAVHSGPEPLRHVADEHPSADDLHDYYLRAFERGIRQGHAESVMAAYNAVDGIPMPANHHLLTDVLRRTWGFDGAVVGDVDTVADIWATHHYAPDAATASALALKAGNDLCSGTTYKALPEALKRGLVTEADIDRALTHLLTLRFKLGQFDPPSLVPFSSITAVDTPQDSALALKAARESMVLLKNNGTLPWRLSDLKTVAVIGPTADNYAALVGNYEGTPSHPITILDGLRAALKPAGVHVLHEPGVPLVAGFQPDLPFPTGSLFTDASRTSPGLKLEVFDNPDLSGKPVWTGADPTAGRTWNAHTQAPGVPALHASLRWSGVFVPAVTGTYVFTVHSNSGYRIRIGDGPVHADWGASPVPWDGIPVKADLKAGVPCPILFEYTQAALDGGYAHLSLGQPLPADAYERALEASRRADHIILTLGITPQLEGEERAMKLPGFDGGDRTSIELPAIQRRLLADVASLGKPFVVVLTTGSALAFDTSKPAAILCAWYYGELGGDAVADILLGKTNPSGRLPITFYANDRQLPPFTDYAVAGRTYRYFTGKPLYAFGYGLSYSHFAFEKLTADSPTVKPDGTIHLSVTVANTRGPRGDEVVQVYARELSSRPNRPLRQLVAFHRVTLQPGARSTVELTIPVSELRHWDDATHAFRVEPCAYAFDVGPSSDRPELSTTVTVAP